MRVFEVALTIGVLLVAAVKAPPGAAQQTGTSAQQAQASAHTPLFVSLSSPSADIPEHDLGRPLMLTVTITNPRAASVRNRNANVQRERERLAASGELEKMTAAQREAFERTFSAVPAPVAVVGSQSDPLWSLIAFEFVHESRDRFVPPVRPLAITKERPASVSLDGAGGSWLAFGVDTASLASVRAGSVEVRATLRTTGRQGMWLGEASSEPMTIRFVSTPKDSSGPDTDDRDYQEGRFHLVDRQFERARGIGERLLARSPGSVAAFELLGDAYDGLGRLDEAERAFAAGIEAFREQASAAVGALTPPDSDHPTYLVERLGNVRAKQKKAR